MGGVANSSNLRTLNGLHFFFLICDSTILFIDLRTFFSFFFFSTLSFPVRRRSIIARSIDEERVYLSTPLPFLSKLPDARSQFDPLDNFYLTHGSRLRRDFGSGQYLQHLHVVFPLVRFDRSTQFRHYPLPGIGKIIEREIELFRYYPLTWMAREQKEQGEGRKEGKEGEGRGESKFRRDAFGHY